MQIENELDFYRCVSPVSYMDKLKRMAEGLEIRVPLFYCCGQNDMLRGGGLTPGLYTAFNVYAAGDNENLEQRVAHLYDSVQDRDMPLLVTETNREHGYLKRLLACGAKLISPYNQTAGSTMDYYNGISNWGTDEEPTAFTPGRQMWDYLYSKDAAEIFYALGTKGRDGSVYCVGSGQARELQSYIKDIYRVVKEYQGGQAAEEDRELENVLGIGLIPYGDKQVMHLCADTTLLEEHIGKIAHTDFDNGIRSILAENGDMLCGKR